MSREQAMARQTVSKIAAITVLTLAIGASEASGQSSAGQITVLYDAFGKTSTMTKDWGFAALVEYGGKRILFDTGNNAEIFAHNVEAKGIDLRQLDFAIVSHRHGDHTSGLNHLLKVNPGLCKNPKPCCALRASFGAGSGHGSFTSSHG
jgi:7,8-dihydropterin-6-yl-methyl-4-(beta-D-ribofuranosyl)aminobenzene 5'-phosphate synthase